MYMPCDSRRVSNELGAERIVRAKNAMAVTIKLSALLTLTIVLALAFGHNLWVSFFSDSHKIIMEFASLTPLVAISITFDSIVCILSGL